MECLKRYRYVYINHSRWLIDANRCHDIASPSEFSFTSLGGTTPRKTCHRFSPSPSSHWSESQERQSPNTSPQHVPERRRVVSANIARELDGSRSVSACEVSSYESTTGLPLGFFPLERERRIQTLRNLPLQHITRHSSAEQIAQCISSRLLFRRVGVRIFKSRRIPRLECGDLH